MPTFDPSDWLDVLVYLVYAIPAIGAAWAAVVAARRGAVTNKKASATLEQVKNNHDTNLRDQLDEIQKDIRGIREDMGGLRGELREERRTRHDADAAIDAAVTRLEKQLGRRDNRP